MINKREKSEVNKMEKNEKKNGVLDFFGLEIEKEEQIAGKVNSTTEEKSSCKSEAKAQKKSEAQSQKESVVAEESTEKKATGDAAATNIFDLLSKLEDLVYLPSKLMCDALRQPLDSINNARENKNKVKEADLNKKITEYEQDLEIRKQRLLFELSDEERRLDEEFKQYQLQNARDNDVAEEANRKKFAQEWAELALELKTKINSIPIDAREKVFKLHRQIDNEYMLEQDRRKKILIENIKDLKELFPNLPDGTMDPTVRAEFENESAMIKEQSRNFLKMLNDEIPKLNAVIDELNKELPSFGSHFVNSQENSVLIQNEEQKKISIEGELVEIED